MVVFSDWKSREANIRYDSYIIYGHIIYGHTQK